MPPFLLSFPNVEAYKKQPLFAVAIQYLQPEAQI